MPKHFTLLLSQKCNNSQATQGVPLQWFRAGIGQRCNAVHFHLGLGGELRTPEPQSVTITTHGKSVELILWTQSMGPQGEQKESSSYWGSRQGRWLGRWHWPVPWEPANWSRNKPFHGGNVHILHGRRLYIMSYIHACCFIWALRLLAIVILLTLPLLLIFSNCEILCLCWRYLCFCWTSNTVHFCWLNLTNTPSSSDVQVWCYRGGWRRAVLYGRFRGGEQETSGLCTPRMGGYHQ